MMAIGLVLLELVLVFRIIEFFQKDDTEEATEKEN